MIKQNLSVALNKMIKLLRRFTHFRVTRLQEAMGKAAPLPSIEGVRKSEIYFDRYTDLFTGDAIFIG